MASVAGARTAGPDEISAFPSASNSAMRIAQYAMACVSCTALAKSTLAAASASANGVLAYSFMASECHTKGNPFYALIPPTERQHAGVVRC